MEHIGQTVLETAERIRLASEERRAAMPDCHEHPGNKRFDCAECAAEEAVRRKQADEDYRQRAQAESVEQAEESFRRFPPRFRGATADNPAVLAWAAQFADTAGTPKGLLLLGPTGVGKTWQAYGALRAACLHPAMTRTGCRCRFWLAAPFADLMAELRPRPKSDAEETMRRFKEIDILLVDDLAAAKGSEWVEEQTYRLINSRYEAMLPTIFTTNLSIGELRNAIGDRIASRLAESCERVVLAGSDRRRQQKGGSQ